MIGGRRKSFIFPNTTWPNEWFMCVFGGLSIISVLRERASIGNEKKCRSSRARLAPRDPDANKEDEWMRYMVLALVASLGLLPESVCADSVTAAPPRLDLVLKPHQTDGNVDYVDIEMSIAHPDVA